MTEKIDPAMGAWQNPLTEKQTLALGRICVLWAQIDFFVDHLLRRAHNLNSAQFDLFVGEKMIGAKLAMLESSLDHVADDKERFAIEQFIADANTVKSHRNHAVHGVWGWKVSAQGEYPAARASKTPGVPLRAEKLKRLEFGVAAAARSGLTAFCFSSPMRIAPGGKFLFGSAGAPPKRMQEGALQFPEGPPTPPKRARSSEVPPQSKRE